MGNTMQTPTLSAVIEQICSRIDQARDDADDHHKDTFHSYDTGSASYEAGFLDALEYAQEIISGVLYEYDAMVSSLELQPTTKEEDECTESV